MEKNEIRFDEQEAPIKNGDQAFVQVGADGKPQLPEDRKEKEAPQDEKDAQKQS